MMMVMRSAFAASLLAQVSAAGFDYPDVYAQPPTTEHGCECQTQCKTSLFAKCFAAPACRVDRTTCKKPIGFLPWDFCVYEPFAEYESKSAVEKKNIVMAHVTKDTHAATYPSPLKVLGGFTTESVKVSMEASSDVFPEKRTKFIHSVGVTGGIKFESLGQHDYTGVFKGSEHGIVRFSSAKAPDTTVAPGMGLKFFRDGRPSANFVAMYSLDGQECSKKDFFANTWSTHITNTDNFGLKLIRDKFWQASYCPLMVGLSDLSSESPGTAGKFPYQLIFKAAQSSDCPCDDYAKCLQNLVNIPTGSKLFEVQAKATPQADAEVIGQITLTDALTTSSFGDNALFFKHQAMEEDFNLKPEWLASVDHIEACSMAVVDKKVPGPEDGCNSPFNKTSAAATLDADMLASDQDFVV